MDNVRGSDQPSSLVELLAIGEEKTRQLEIHLQELTPSEPWVNLIMAQEIRSLFNKAISTAKLMANGREIHQECNTAVTIATDSPHFVTDSPRSDTSELAFKDIEHEMSKKRKMQAKWTNHVRLVAGPRADGPMDDGYSWRKYGQKDILGAKYPRGYYRCSYRNTQGCPAMKQVQRCETDSSIFDVTYRGEHICLQKKKTSLPSPFPPLASNNAGGQPNQTKNSLPINQSQQLLLPYQLQDQELLQSFKTSLKVKTEGLENSEISSASFSFQSTPLSCPAAPEHDIFSPPPSLDNHFIDSFPSASFGSPAISESVFFSRCVLKHFSGGPATLNPSEPEVISASTSAANSPIVDRDYVEFGDIDNSDLSRFFS